MPTGRGRGFHERNHNMHKVSRKILLKVQVIAIRKWKIILKSCWRRRRNDRLALLSILPYSRQRLWVLDVFQPLSSALSFSLHISCNMSNQFERKCKDSKENWLMFCVCIICSLRRKNRIYDQKTAHPPAQNVTWHFKISYEMQSVSLRQWISS